MQLVISVTQKDIDKARTIKGFRSQTCPIALAIKRRCLPDVVVSVTHINVGFTYSLTSDTYRVALPEIALAFVYFFDAGITTKPIRFKLDIPDEYTRN